MSNNCEGENDNIKHVIERQLEVYYSLAKLKHTKSMTIRQWFLTVMIAFTSLIISSKPQIDTKWFYYIPVGIAVMFWYLEIINQTFARIEYKFIEKLENIIIQEKYNSFNPNEHLVVTSYKYPTPWFKKIKIFCKKVKIFFVTALSSWSTVVGFYLPILGIIELALYLFINKTAK